MKCIKLLLFIMVFGQAALFAQTFESVFGSDTTQWNYVTDYGGADFIATAVYKAYSDTLINDKHYHKLSENYIHGIQLFGFVREDTIQGKFWLKFPDDTSDFLLMNLNLAINDTFLLRHKNAINEKFVVKSVSNNPPKSIKLQGITSFKEIEFIEGVGVDYIFRVIDQSWVYYQLLCSYKNNTITYDNPNNPLCYVPFTSTGISEIDSKRIKIYPSPAYSQLTIEICQGSILRNRCRIYDLSGNKLEDIEFDSSCLIIDVSKYKTGLYLIGINDETVKKVIIYNNQ